MLLRSERPAHSNSSACPEAPTTFPPWKQGRATHAAAASCISPRDLVGIAFLGLLGSSVSGCTPRGGGGGGHFPSNQPTHPLFHPLSAKFLKFSWNFLEVAAKYSDFRQFSGISRNFPANFREILNEEEKKKLLISTNCCKNLEKLSHQIFAKI